MIDAGGCRWVNVVGRNRFVLERVRQRLALPSRLVALTLSDHLQPTVIRIRPAWLVVTGFTIPSRRHVFRRHPLLLWITTDAVVTISPWAPRRGMGGAPRVRTAVRDTLLHEILDALVASHEDVGWHLNDAFFGEDLGDDHVEWHRKERRLTRYGELLEHQLWVVRTLGANRLAMGQVYQQLSGLSALARYVERAVRGSGYCRECTRERTVSPRQALTRQSGSGARGSTVRNGADVGS